MTILQLRNGMAGWLLVCMELASAAAEPPTATPTPAATAATAPAVTPSATPATTPAAVPAADERAAAYVSFREHFAAGRFTEALPEAKKVVELTEQRFGADQLQLVNPLTNLATTQLRLQDFSSAEDTFQRAIKIAEARDGGFSRVIIKPLLGLGVTYSAAGQPEDAAKALSRAVDVSRKLDGLFNVAQLELVDPLIDSYVALGQIENAEREQQYALRLSESAYGKDDPRLLPALDRSALWCEKTGHYLRARQAHARALGIIFKAGNKNDVRMVGPLRGIARAYRLEFLYGTSETDENDYSRTGPLTPPTFSASAGPTGTSPGSGRLTTDGERSLQRAVEIVRAQLPADQGLLGETLIDMGDWYQVASQQGAAMRSYKEAWQALNSPGAPGTASLNAPALIYYREPNSARPDPNAEPEKIEQHVVELEFTVTKDGQVKDVKTVATDASDSQEKSAIGAIKRARYRPRFADGEPVETQGTRHRLTVFNKK